MTTLLSSERPEQVAQSTSGERRRAVRRVAFDFLGGRGRGRVRYADPSRNRVSVLRAIGRDPIRDRCAGAASGKIQSSNYQLSRRRQRAAVPRGGSQWSVCWLRYDISNGRAPSRPRPIVRLVAAEHILELVDFRRVRSLRGVWRPLHAKLKKRTTVVPPLVPTVPGVPGVPGVPFVPLAKGCPTGTVLGTSAGQRHS